MIRSCQVGQLELDKEDPWSGILAAVMFATHATYHTTTQATPAQLVFGRDAILNTKFEADWKYIRARKQQLIDQNNFNENKKRISHQYKVGDKVLYRIDSMSKFNDNPYEGPYQIVHVYTNGTVRLKMGAVTDTVNIRLIKPYRD
jgi:protein associated with RNAse G/E